jgi:hypothetical protein
MRDGKTAQYDFPTRLTLARALIARGGPPAPGHVADQIDAAGAEARVALDRLGVLLPLLAPDRNWREWIDITPSADIRAYLVAAVLGCAATCCHLKRGGPQPVFLRLSLRRADCSRCVATLRLPPRGEDDRCDLCGARDVVTFVPMAVRQGPALVVGDVCIACANVLGIAQEVSA